jgi:hypothetical protein
VGGGIERKVNLKLLFNYLTIGYVDNPNIPKKPSLKIFPNYLPHHFLSFQLLTFNFQFPITGILM